MGFLFYTIIAILIAVGVNYSIHRLLGPKVLDGDEMPMAIGICLIYGLAWPISIPITLVVFLVYLARTAGLKAYSKKHEKP
jgi:presenilin-like A22 family membrane protease